MKNLFAAVVLAVLLAASPSFAQSPDNSRVPPLTALTDASGAVWTLEPGEGIRTIYRNGTPNGGGSLLLMFAGNAWTVAGGSGWWMFDGANWNGMPGGEPIFPPVEPPPPAAGATLAWTMAFTDLATVTTGTFTLYIGTAAQPLPAVSCAVAAPNVLCSAPLPVLAVGTYALTLTFTSDAQESDPSNTLTVILSVAVVPVSPSDLTLQ